MPLRHWCAGSREDAVTGLVAFPDFHSHLPRELVTALGEGRMVGLAIGDVDGLKAHVEQTNATSATSFGHLEGNRVMSRLGATTRDWFHDQPWERGCAATFGGDEVIVAAITEGHDDFAAALGRLRDTLAIQLPVTVSFAYAIITPTALPEQRPAGWKHGFTDQALTEVDHALFLHKDARRSASTTGGTLALTYLPSPLGTAGAVALAPQPTPGQTAHVVARPGPLAGTIVLPCRGPEGMRGQRLRVSAPGQKTRTELVLSQNGQAVLTGSRLVLTTPTALRLEGVRERSAHTVPSDLAEQLERLDLDWSAVPAHEQTQILHLLIEASDPHIRAGRLDNAITAIRARSR
jgi:GGDEF domain-containing protein